VRRRSVTQYGDLPVISLAGSAQERGITHGEILGERIHQYLEKVMGIYSAREGGWGQVLKISEHYREFIGGIQPAALEEMRGIAEGAEVSLEAIVALSIDHELRKIHGCTNIVALPSATRSGHTLVGKTYDEPYQRLKTDALFVVSPDQGPRFVTLTSVGTLSRDGFNEHGLVLLGSGLRGRRDGEVIGLPFSVLRRIILAQHGIPGVGVVLNKAPRNQACNYTVALAAGEARCFEASVDGVYEVAPKDGLLIHTNHFLAPQAQGLDRRDPASAKDSQFRLKQARHMLEPKIGSLTLQDIQCALSDHTGYPGSVCSHREDTGTLSSYWMDLNEGVFCITNGPPCITPVIKISLEELGFHFHIQ
jgi:isopenicillin-N N-acyltransferase-like protein